MAPSAVEVSGSARAVLRHWEELDAAPLDLDPRPAIRAGAAAADLRRHPVRPRAGARPPGDLDKEIAVLAAQAPYAEPVGWLRCFRGIDTLSAMILVAEIVAFQRFRRPRELMAYVGLVPSEYSSGETVRRGAITKTGNAHVRRAL